MGGVDPRPCDRCKGDLERLPCKPELDVPGSGGRLVFAVNSARFGMDGAKPTDWETIGLDLDCLDTGSSNQPSACKVDPLTNARDGTRGRDNAFASTFGSLVQNPLLGQNVETDSNRKLNEGDWGILVTLDNYGGGPDDRIATVSLVVAGKSINGAGKQVAPVWDGHDTWQLEKGTVDADGKHLYADVLAYVANDVVVAHLPKGLPIFIGSDTAKLTVSLDQAILTYRLVRQGGAIVGVRDGVLAGVWNKEFAEAAFKSWAAQQGLCPLGPTAIPYSIVLNTVTRSADVFTDLDVVEPTVPCNGISVGIAFTALPANPGPVVDAEPEPPSQCP